MAIFDRDRVNHTSDIALARMLGEVEAMTEEEAEEMTEIEKSIGIEGKRYEHARIKHYILSSEQQFAFT
ncbi:MAG: hypothetical protein ACTHLX_00360 [Candidatus Binatia bacterium]